MKARTTAQKRELIKEAVHNIAALAGEHECLRQAEEELDKAFRQFCTEFPFEPNENLLALSEKHTTEDILKAFGMTYKELNHYVVIGLGFVEMNAKENVGCSVSEVIDNAGMADVFRHRLLKFDKWDLLARFGAYSDHVDRLILHYSKMDCPECGGEYEDAGGEQEPETGAWVGCHNKCRECGHEDK